MNMTAVDPNGQLQQLLDRAEITDLVNRLGRCLDEGRFDAMASLFVGEASARTPGGTAEGRDALIAQARRNHRPDDAIQHVITNALVDLDGDGDGAEVRANLVVHFASRPGEREAGLAPPVEFVLGEIYRFDAVRTPDGWRLSRVETTPVWRTGPPPAAA